MQRCPSRNALPVDTPDETEGYSYSCGTSFEECGDDGIRQEAVIRGELPYGVDATG